MAQHGGYAIVDADEELGAIEGNTVSSGLEFKSLLAAFHAWLALIPIAFLSTDPAPGRSASPNAAREAPEVPYSSFQLAYYQTYFDIDTTTVLKRVGMAMIPREGFVTDVCEGQIDLYGPFWTLTTLILILYTTSTLTSSITQYLADPNSYVHSNLPLLSTAISTIYIYGIAVPALLWAATRWLGLGQLGLAEAIGIYGYGMTVFVPISLLCLIPVGVLRWVLVGLGAASSGYFLIRNIYPVLAADDNKLLQLLVIAIGVLHAAVALLMKVFFFSYSVGGVKIGADPLAEPIGTDAP